jgi:serine/threonine protein kinase
MRISVIGGDITSHVVTGLIPGSSYIIEMTSVNANGEESGRSGGSPIITAEDVPGPPRNVTWYEIQDGHLNVTWLPPSSPNGLIIRYTITVTYDNDVTITYNVTSNELFILIPRPPTNGVFTISVVAVNSVGASQPMDAIMMERSSIPPGALVGIILAVILLVVVAILCLLIIMYLVWRKWLHGSGLEDNIGEIEYKTNNKDVDLINVIDGYDTNCIDGDDSQLTAKRWMRANANYSTPSVLLPSISELVSRYSTAEDVVATKTISRPQLNGLSTLSEAPFESNNSSSERSQDAPSTLSSVCSKETNKVIGLTSFELSEREAKMRDSEIVDGNQPLFEMMENVYLPSPFDKQCLEEYFKDESSISLREQIGSGDHNKVMAGLIGSCEDIVAVKLIKDECVSEEEFLGAGYIMSQLNHDNILGLMGVVLSPLMLVVPYMELCDLKKYLVRVRRRTRLEHQPCNFTVKDQLNISLQVASGMEYLSSKFYIHKCLQSKYVLLDEDFNVKISGFQMSRVLSNPGRFHELKMADRLPTKWFALETLTSDRFNPYTDVWSFGVVLWEIFAYGLTPYRGLSNRDIADHLSKGERLNKPSDCPDDIYTLMLHCWNIKCRERPTFNQLCTHLRGISEATKSSIQQQSSPTAFNIFDFSGLPSLDQSENVTTLEQDDQLEMGVVLRNPRNTPVLLPEEQGRDSNNSVSLSIPELVLSAQPRDSVNIVQTIIGANNQLMSTEDYTVL